jgi:hypothetical protein
MRQALYCLHERRRDDVINIALTKGKRVHLWLGELRWARGLLVGPAFSSDVQTGHKSRHPRAFFETSAIPSKAEALSGGPCEYRKP